MFFYFLIASTGFNLVILNSGINASNGIMINVITIINEYDTGVRTKKVIPTVPPTELTIMEVLANPTNQVATPNPSKNAINASTNVSKIKVFLS